MPDPVFKDVDATARIAEEYRRAVATEEALPESDKRKQAARSYRRGLLVALQWLDLAERCAVSPTGEARLRTDREVHGWALLVPKEGGRP
jgi:hypothetical protein